MDLYVDCDGDDHDDDDGCWIITSDPIHICFCILFLLHPIDKTLVVQYHLIQSCLNYVYIIIKW